MKKIFLIILLFLTFSCSKDFNYKKISKVESFPVAKISGKHAVFISKNKFFLNKKFESEDCESWAVNLELDKPLRSSIKSLIEEMFQNYIILDEKLEKSEIEKKGYVSQILFSDFQGVSNFKTNRNTGNYSITLTTKIKIENSSKSFSNEISSNMIWDKNIFLNCNLKVGAINSGQKALDNLVKKIYETTYESLYQIMK